MSGKLTARAPAGEMGEQEYAYYPREWSEPYLGRRRAIGWSLYKCLGIERGQEDRMRRQHARNFSFFDAPGGLLFTIDRTLEIGSWLDYGMFLQNIMIAARGLGLHTCPQAALANYPGIVKTHLGTGDDKIAVCGTSIGYEDPDAIVNGYQPDRIPLEEFVTYHG